MSNKYYDDQLLERLAEAASYALDHNYILCLEGIGISIFKGRQRLHMVSYLDLKQGRTNLLLPAIDHCVHLYGRGTHGEVCTSSADSTA